MRVTAPIVAGLLTLLVGCGSVFSGGGDCFKTVGSEAHPAREYVGLELSDAESKAAAERKVLRVVGRDGECIGGDADLVLGRVNVSVQSGTVAEAQFG